MTTDTALEYTTTTITAISTCNFPHRSLMCWCSLYETMKLEDIYASLYMIKGDLIYRREHKRGEPQWTSTKFFNGTLLFLALMLIICGPLLIFSTANPVSTTNLVERGQISVGIIDVHHPNSEFDLAQISSFRFETVRDKFQIFHGVHCHGLVLSPLFYCCCCWSCRCRTRSIRR